MEDILKVKDICKYFLAPISLRELFASGLKRKHLVCALEHVSFSLKKNSILCILGPNGAGKTTLLKIISQLILADRGEILVNGHIREEEIKASVGLLLDEERSFYWRLSGRQNLEFFAALYGLSKKATRERISRYFELFDIDYGEKRFGSYSTGMKKHFSLIRALLHEPDLLLLDEPTKSLDYASQLKLKNFIKEELLGRQGKTILFCTHNIPEAMDFAENFMILHKGKVLALGTLGEIRKQLNDPILTLEEIFIRLTENN